MSPTRPTGIQLIKLVLNGERQLHSLTYGQKKSMVVALKIHDFDPERPWAPSELQNMIVNGIASLKPRQEDV